MIDYLTYYYKRGTDPFRSLCALSDEEALQIMRDLYVEGSVIWERFRDPVQYLHDRRQTEQWVRARFIAKGGRPQAAYAISMVLGKSKWILENTDADTAELCIPLAMFAEWDISFTYPDSMISYWLGKDKPAEYYLPEYHGQVFTCAEILAIVERKGLPEEAWETNLPRDLAPYIEAQVWNHQPLLEYKQHIAMVSTY